MKILVRPRYFEGDKSWEQKWKGVVLVEKEEDIEKLWILLCAQDDYWESYKNLIKVAPVEIDSEADIARMCEYVGKTDIYDVESLKERIPFIIYQEYPQ